MIIVKKEQNPNGSHANQTADFLPDGYLILPEELKPEHFPFFSITAFEGDTITSVEDGVYPPVSAEITRRIAYETEPMVEYGGDTLTVDEAINLCTKYAFEATERAENIVTELTAKITAAKEAIRGR